MPRDLGGIGRTVSVSAFEKKSSGSIKRSKSAGESMEIRPGGEGFKGARMESEVSHRKAGREEHSGKPSRRPGRLAGMLSVHPSFFEALTEDELRDFYGE